MRVLPSGVLLYPLAQVSIAQLMLELRKADLYTSRTMQ